MICASADPPDGVLPACDPLEVESFRQGCRPRGWNIRILRVRKRVFHPRRSLIEILGEIVENRSEPRLDQLFLLRVEWPRLRNDVDSLFHTVLLQHDPGAEENFIHPGKMRLELVLPLGSPRPLGWIGCPQSDDQIVEELLNGPRRSSCS